MIKIIGILLAFGLGYMTAYNELLAYMLQEVINDPARQHDTWQSIKVFPYQNRKQRFIFY